MCEGQIAGNPAGFPQTAVVRLKGDGEEDEKAYSSSSVITTCGWIDRRCKTALSFCPKQLSEHLY